MSYNIHKYFSIWSKSCRVRLEVNIERLDIELSSIQIHPSYWNELQFKCYCLDGYCIFIWNHNKQSNPIFVSMYTSMELVSNHFFHNMEGGRRGARRQRDVGFTAERLAGEEEQSRVSPMEGRKKAGFCAYRGWKGVTQRCSTPGGGNCAAGTARHSSIRLRPPQPCCAFAGVPRRRPGREEGMEEGARCVSEVRPGRQWATVEGARRISKVDEVVVVSLFSTRRQTGWGVEANAVEYGGVRLQIGGRCSQVDGMSRGIHFNFQFQCYWTSKEWHSRSQIPIPNSTKLVIWLVTLPAIGFMQAKTWLFTHSVLLLEREFEI
jgi:hypothetical protein